MIGNFLIFFLVCLGLAILFHFLADSYYNLFLGFLAVLLYCVSFFSFLFFVFANSSANSLRNQNIAKDLDTQLYYIIGYMESHEDISKTNEYYETVIKEVEKYNKIYTNYEKDCKAFDVTPKEEFANYQMMIYNYNDNTITWEDGTSIFKGENNNG